MKGLRSFSLFVVLTLFLGGIGWSQSLAQAAKKEKERQSKLKNVKVRTFSNKDLKAKKPASEGTQEGTKTVSTVGTPKPATTAPKAKAANREMEKKAWLDEYRKLRQKEYDLKQQIARLEKDIRIMTMGYMASDFPDQTQILRDEIAHKRGLQKAAREELEQTRKAIQKLMRDARGAGVRPGDFRAIDRELERKFQSSSKPEGG